MQTMSNVGHRREVSFATIVGSGALPAAAHCHPTIYKKVTGQLRHMRRVGGVYSNKVKGTFIPMTPQPDSSTVITIFRTYSTLSDLAPTAPCFVDQQQCTEVDKALGCGRVCRPLLY